MKIKNFLIGENKPCFIIAEAGVNHNGSVETAKKLIDAAVSSNANAIKFQTFKSEDVVSKNVDIAEYAKKNIKKNIKQIDMIKKYELKYDDFVSLKNYCDKKNMVFLSTPHSFDAIDFLDDLIPAYKFSSGDLTNIPSLVYAAKKRKPMILGTGMSTLKEVKFAVDSIKKTGNKNIVVLHCTTNYPCPIDEVNLNAMLTMKKKLDCMVGYSDHTLSLTVPVMARSLGAVIIEKHLTLNRYSHGPDHKASLEPDEFKLMVDEIRKAEKALGSDKKNPTLSEKKIIKYSRKSIVAKKMIKKDEIIKNDMLAIKRPGNGLSPSLIEKVIGKKAKRDIEQDELISWSNLK